MVHLVTCIIASVANERHGLGHVLLGGIDFCLHMEIHKHGRLVV